MELNITTEYISEVLLVIYVGNTEEIESPGHWLHIVVTFPRKSA